MNDIYEMMSTLRAVRRLRPDPIPEDVLNRVLQAAAWAPTGGNMQPWRVIGVTSPERKKALADIHSLIFICYNCKESSSFLFSYFFTSALKSNRGMFMALCRDNY